MQVNHCLLPPCISVFFPAFEPCTATVPDWSGDCGSFPVHPLGLAPPCPCRVDNCKCSQGGVYCTDWAVKPMAKPSNNNCKNDNGLLRLVHNKTPNFWLRVLGPPSPNRENHHLTSHCYEAFILSTTQCTCSFFFLRLCFSCFVVDSSAESLFTSAWLSDNFALASSTCQWHQARHQPVCVYQ